MVPEGSAATVADAEELTTAAPATKSVAMARRRECPTCIVVSARATEMAISTAPATSESSQRYRPDFTNR
jgi:hypothetical protein